jgi:hypothetical protein
MKRQSFFLKAVVAALFCCGVAYGDVEQIPQPSFTVGINMLDPFVGLIISQSISSGGEHSLYPFLIECQKGIGKQSSIGSTLIYEYNIDGSYLQTNEFALGVGPRYTFSSKLFSGFYASYKLGVGYGWGKNYSGKDYYRISLLSLPEIGVSHSWGSPGFYLSGGIGIRSLFSLYESPEPITWNGFGKFCRELLPVFNLTLGYCR